MKRPGPATTLAIAGACGIALGFAYDLTFAGLPYPDPTPEMQARWDAHKSVAGWIMAVGGVTFLAGILLGIMRWVWRRIR